MHECLLQGTVSIHLGNTIHLQGVGSDPELQLLCNVVVSPQLQVSNKNANVKGAGLWSKTLCLNQGMVEVQERSVPVLRKQSGCPGKQVTHQCTTMTACFICKQLLGMQLLLPNYSSHL